MGDNKAFFGVFGANICYADYLEMGTRIAAKRLTEALRRRSPMYPSTGVTLAFSRDGEHWVKAEGHVLNLEVETLCRPSGAQSRYFKEKKVEQIVRLEIAADEVVLGFLGIQPTEQATSAEDEGRRFVICPWCGLKNNSDSRYCGEGAEHGCGGSLAGAEGAT